MLNEIDAFLSAHANIGMWTIIILIWTAVIFFVWKSTKFIAIKNYPIIKKWVVEAEAKKRQKEREQNH